jgi:AraC-like DNA-binding protein
MPIPAGYREQSHSDPSSVEATWTYLALDDTVHRVLPDGRCDLILRFACDGDRQIGKIEPLIAGPATSYHLVSLSRGVGYAGLRLRPGTAGMVLGVDLRSIADQVFIDHDAIRIAPALASLLEPAPNVESLTSRLVDFVAQRRTDSQDAGASARSLELIDALHTGGGRLSVADLARMNGIDERTVRRDIKTSTGLAPKELSIVLQFHRALRLLREVGLDPASAADEAGYADQAHMTRVFRKLGGFTPANMPELTLANLPI